MYNQTINKKYQFLVPSNFKEMRRRKRLLSLLRNQLLKKVLNFDNTENKMELYKKMMQKSMHYGHQIVKCSPGMKKMIRGTSAGGAQYINLMLTRRYLVRVLWYLTKYAYQKKTILFVGTTVASARFVATAAVKTKSFFVNVRWLGGMLSNWKTIRKLILKLRKLQKEFKNIKNSIYTKKEIAVAKKEKQRLEKYLKGMKLMKRFPQVVIMTSQLSDKSAAFECKKMGICNISIVDTNCNPSLADFIVPANDDSAASIKYLLYYFSRAILAGRALYNMKKKLSFKQNLKKRSFKQNLKKSYRN